MAALLLISFIAGIVLAIPVWIVRQHTGSRRGLRVSREFDPREAVPCEIEPVVLEGRLLPQSEMQEGRVR
ncbi:hypothetical protein WKR88_16995 [Trinickia caryophylli]|uniref:Uncharacterized protein n=1 Tax=Trinickia caryophylli TaxID=28094 RepID=A0A1X7GCM6_TRICW|nr:hypothetical protein [Trinickia caryophylli]PMS10830.1 hypothetical protein C0Z17_18255 [Trinickia caryophylli]TRX13793.1 hypothetical protein FNF07_20710 [Trinickia caryophylli]WQE15384.1 hypothetical protein U0034_22915 [Trinickia caryophylli]SMF67627.1 hypothetical protein SAMN06295900_11516 [Trinickia caryophylli]GLU33881.1 hypothetical protein Busp01_37230 [Trinickia caryophylli]